MHSYKIKIMYDFSILLNLIFGLLDMLKIEQSVLEVPQRNVDGK